MIGTTTSGISDQLRDIYSILMQVIMECCYIPVYGKFTIRKKICLSESVVVIVHIFCLGDIIVLFYVLLFGRGAVMVVIVW